MSGTNPQQGPSSMTIAITGAAGTVGKVLRQQLAEMGYQCLLLDVQPIHDCRPNERAILVDVTDQPRLTEALKGAKAVIHLAACTTDAAWPDQIKLSIEGTISLFDAARANGIKRVVYTSSHHVVGFHGRAQPLDHQAVLLPDSRYAVGKAFGESIGGLYACKYDIQVFCIRIGNVNTRPIDRRRLGNWLSGPDLGQLMKIGLEHPAIVFEVVYGISDATGRDYDNRRAYELGYRPTATSEPWLAAVLSEDPAPPEGSAESQSPAETTLGGLFSASEFIGSPERLKAVGH
jgi:uronate dehydrogenase